MNKATIVGTVTRAESKTVTMKGEQVAVVDVRIEAKDRYKNAQGDVYENIRVIEVSLWGRLAELHSGVREGSLVEVDGEVRGRVIQASNGGEFVNHSIVAKNFNVLSATGATQSAPTHGHEGPPPAPPTPPANEFGDDDIPF